MKTLAAAFCITLFVSNATRADDDLKALEGTWSANAGPGKDHTLTLTVKGASIELTMLNPQGVSRAAKGELKVDASKTPMQMDWLKMRHEDRDMPDRHLIYEFKDDGKTLRIDGGQSDERPSAFAPVEEGKPTSTLIFKKQP